MNWQTVAMLNTSTETVESLRLKMNEAASTPPEYPIVMSMNNVGSTLDPQLMAEIGDVISFTHYEALTAFLMLTLEKRVKATRPEKFTRNEKGSPNLRKTLFQIMDKLIKH